MLATGTIRADSNPIIINKISADLLAFPTDIIAYSLEKDWATFDFCELERSNGIIRAWNLATDFRQRDSVQVPLATQVPAYGLAPMEFLGRTWLKPDDHSAYLNAVYGDWTKPNPAYDFIKDDLSIVEMCPWTGSSDWPLEEALAGRTGEQAK